MKQILGCIKKADIHYNMINDGDKIAIGLSGGKDSVLLLYALSLYKLFSKKKFNLHAFTVSMDDDTSSFSPLSNICDELEIPLIIKKTDLVNILFHQRQEKNPCSLCSKMRRGILVNLAIEQGCNKLALGHHGDDATETLLLSLFYENRLHTFEPSSYLSRKDIYLIRPIIYVKEKQVISVMKKLNLPSVKNVCPIDGHTKRQEVKKVLDDLSISYPKLRSNILKGMQSFWQNKYL